MSSVVISTARGTNVRCATSTARAISGRCTVARGTGAASQALPRITSTSVGRRGEHRADGRGVLHRRAGAAGPALSRLRGPRVRSADLADRIGAALQGEWYSTTCPVHVDTTPSCTFKDGDRGIAFHCFAGCPSKAVADAMARRLHVRVADFFFPPTLVATYDYLDEQGDLLFQTVRSDPKAFTPRRPAGPRG
jgi:hypothetical protein